ncbi:hypothetical protein ES708_22375 [subsurface metagenome]
MGCPQGVELLVLLDDIGHVERKVFLSRLYIGVPHYLLEGAQVSALHEEVFAKSVTKPMWSQLGPLDACLL